MQNGKEMMDLNLRIDGSSMDFLLNRRDTTCRAMLNVEINCRPRNWRTKKLNVKPASSPRSGGLIGSAK